jgi:pimeloyl-ACP methyl ester carboxylesterase
MLMSSSSVPLSTPEYQDEAKETLEIRYLSRREMLGLMGATSIAVTLTGCAGEQSDSSASPSAAAAETTSAQLSTPEGPLSVSGAPNLPDGFTDTFTSRYIDTGELRQHAVIGGEGPPLLLVHGWPQNWYAWRMLMPELARDFEVIAVDQRGIGLTDKPEGGYDTGTLAGDLVALMDALGHERFAVVGHDTGLIISYALAADHPDRVDRLVVAEVPGPLGVGPSPPLFGLPEPINNKLWHLAFNRVNDELTEQLVAGREDVFFGYEFAIQAGGEKLPDEVQRYYFDLFSDPDVLRGSFGFYRALDTTLAQNAERKSQPLTMPVLAIGGAESWGEEVGNGMKSAADDVQSVVIDGVGHWVAEQAPEEMLAALSEFLAPYSENGGGLR